MNIEKNSETQCTAELGIVLDAGEMAKYRDKAIGRISAKASMPGFRKGKIPRNLIEKHFAENVLETAKREAIDAALAEAAKDESFKDRLLRFTDLKDEKYETGGEMTFSVTVELFPQFDLPAYKSIKVEKREPDVTDASVEEAVANLRKRLSSYKDAAEGEAAAEDDFASIAFKGTVDGKPVEEIAPDAKAVGSSEGFWTAIREGAFIPEIVDALKGMKQGETKNVDVRFPDTDASPDTLKGLSAVYEVSLKQLRKAVPPDDAELAKLSGVEDMEALRKQIREHLEAEFKRSEETRIDDEVIAALLKDATFDIPPSNFQAERNAFLQRLSERAQRSGLPADYFEKNSERIKAQAEEAAMRQVRLDFILEKIAEAEKIEASRDEVLEEIANISAASGRKPGDVYKRLLANGGMGGVAEHVTRRKTLAKIVEGALAAS